MGLPENGNSTCSATPNLTSVANMKHLCTFLLLVAVVQCVLGKDEAQGFTDGIVTSLKHCLKQKEKMDCLKKKVIVKLENEIKNNRSIEIANGVYLARDPNAQMENSVMARQFHADVAQARGSALNSLLLSKIADYFKTTVVQFKLNDAVDEARKKKGGKGGGMMMYAAMGLATVLGQIFLGKLALVSGAALMIAKISLLLALLTALKKLSGGGGGGGEHVVYATKEEHGGGSGGGGGWQRSGIAQEMAYRGRISRQNKLENFVPSTAYAYYQGEPADMDVS